MNKTLIFNTIHRLLSRPLALLVMAGYGLYVLVNGVIRNSGFQSDPNGSAGAAWVLTWALGSGLLGTDRAEGTLPLLLSRPLSRAHYVFSRFLGLLCCVLSVDLALQGVVAVFSASAASNIPGTIATPFSLAPLVERWLWFTYFATLTAAWITLLSAVFRGHGDLIYFIGASLAAVFLATRTGGGAYLSQVSSFLDQLWKPGQLTLKLWTTLDHSGAAYTVLIFVASAGVCLAVAAYIMQRRDVSYVNR